MRKYNHHRNRNADALIAHSRIGQGKLAQQRKQEELKRKRANQRHARMMRDKAIMEIHSLSYSRKGKLVPRRKEWKEKLHAAMERARVYAALARPDGGYHRDPNFPRVSTYPEGATFGSPKGGLTVTHRIAERNRLTFWLSVLEMRKAPLEVRERVEEHLERLSRKIARELENDGVRRRGSRKEYNLLPASGGTMITVEKR